MSIRLILTDNEITINEELKDNETIYNYINRAIKNFDNKDNVKIYIITYKKGETYEKQS